MLPEITFRTVILSIQLDWPTTFLKKQIPLCVITVLFIKTISTWEKFYLRNILSRCLFFVLTFLKLRILSSNIYNPSQGFRTLYSIDTLGLI